MAGSHGAESLTPAGPARSYETSIAGWSFALAGALEVYGIDSAAVFREAGIELGEVSSADARLPVANARQVIQTYKPKLERAS